MTPVIMDLIEWCHEVGVSGIVQPGFVNALVVVGPDGQGKLARTPAMAAALMKEILAKLDPPATFEIDVTTQQMGPLREELAKVFPDLRPPPTLH